MLHGASIRLFLVHLDVRVEAKETPVLLVFDLSRAQTLDSSTELPNQVIPRPCASRVVEQVTNI
jgi:hypothetical protein